MSDQTPDAAVPQDETPVSAPEPVVEQPTEAVGDAETKPEAVEPAKESKGVQKRLDELRRQAGDAQRLNERLVSLLEKQVAGGGQLPTVEAPSGPPARDQYSTDLEYLEARADYKAHQTVQEIHRQAERVKTEQSVAQREASWTQRQEQAATKYEDYQEVVSDPDLRISPVMAEAIKDSDVGHELAYHLGKNPSEAARIAGLSPVSQVRELGKIEARLTTVTSKPVSKASTPIDPITGGKGGTGNPATMSMDEYAAWRAKRG